MKAIILLSALVFVSYFEGTKAQDDYDRRLEAFIAKALPGLPNWMRENGFVPDPLWKGGNFTLTSADEINEPNFDLSGEILDRSRYYHGADKNIRALHIQSNLSNLHFKINLAYGDGENDFIESAYFLDGTRGGVPVHGSGKIRRTKQLRTQLSDQSTCFLQVSDKGHFVIERSESINYLPQFQNFIIDGLDWAGAPRDITSVVEAWYMSQFEIWDNPQTILYFMDYMRQVFAATPVEEIVGAQLAPTSSPKKLAKSPAISREEFYDDERNEWGLKSFYSY